MQVPDVWDRPASLREQRSLRVASYLSVGYGRHMREPRNTHEEGVEATMPDQLVEEGQRRRLLEALVVVTTEVGYPAATPELICARARVPLDRFQSLYGRKYVLFAAAYDTAARRQLARMEAAVDVPGDGHYRLQSGIDALLGWCEVEPRAARLCIVEVLAAGAVARRQRESTMRALALSLEPPLAELRPTQRLARLGARAIVGAAHELMYEALECGSTVRLAQLGRELAAIQGTAVAA
ncbi:MAG TPA: hypothetical protein VI111_01190 [Thermoleophilaceae bacterium]